MIAPSAILLVLAVADGGADELPLLEKLKPSVLELVEVAPNGDVAGNGTGFIVSEDGLLITNHHVIAHLTQLEARTAWKKTLEVEGVLLDDEEQDLAVLKLKGEGFTPIPLKPFVEVREGDRVSMLACPLGLGWTYVQGTVSAIRPDGMPPELLKHQELPGDRLPVLQLDLNSGGGSSGGPIVDTEGRLVGVMRAGFGEVSSFSLAIPSSAVAERIAKARQAKVQPLHPFPLRNLLVSLALFLGLGGFWVFKTRSRPMR